MALNWSSCLILSYPSDHVNLRTNPNNPCLLFFLSSRAKEATISSAARTAPHLPEEEPRSRGRASPRPWSSWGAGDQRRAPARPGGGHPQGSRGSPGRNPQQKRQRTSHGLVRARTVSLTLDLRSDQYRSYLPAPTRQVLQ
jgi:hypothetical protein